MSAKDRDFKNLIQESPLVAAAAGLEAEIRQFEELTAQASRISLESQKQLDLAVKTTQQAAESHGRFGEHLRALISAVDTARQRQNASAEALNSRVAEIQERQGRYEALRERFASLGQEAQHVHQLVQQAQARKAEAQTAPDFDGVVALIASAVERMESVAETAKSIETQAGEEGLNDLEKQAEGLRQQILSARNRLQLLAKSLNERSPGAGNGTGGMTN